MDEPMTATTVSLAGRLAAARREYDALRPAVEGGEPWQLASQFGVEPEASWGPREVLAHVAEMLPFWQGELERVLAAGGDPAEPAPFGRVASDPLRIGILERDRTLPFRELFDRVDAGIARLERRLRELTPREVNAVGVHPSRGPMNPAQIVERFVAVHLEEHIAQLREILEGA